MIIELNRGEKIIPIVLNESILLPEELINETGHVMEGQYAAAKLAAEKAYDLIKYGDGSSCEINVSEFHLPFKKIIIEINFGLLKTKASLTNITTEGELKINIFFRKADKFLGEEYCVDTIASAIIHEMSHGGIYFSRYYNTGDVGEDTPDYYDNLISIMNDDYFSGKMEYYLAFALYSTYYHEVQAMVSQTAFDIKRLLQGKENIGSNDIKRVLARTNTYQTYATNLKYTIPNIRSMGVDEQVLLLNNMKENGVEIKNLNKTLKRIEVVSTEALKAAASNAMLVLNK